MSLAEAATLIEDAIDVHDRHWKDPGMLNFAQLSATLNLRAVMEKTRGSIDEELLGRLQNSASDRNWDPIESLWTMKNEVRDDAELRAAFEPEDTKPSRRRCGEDGTPVHRRRIDPYSASSAGTLSGATSSSSRPCARRWARSRDHSRLSHGRLRLSGRHRTMRRDHRGSIRRDPGRTPDDALEEMRVANASTSGWRTDAGHHFYIDQGANAHMRLVLLAVGQKLVEAGGSTSPTTSCSCATTSCGCSSETPMPSTRGRSSDATCRAGRRSNVQPRDWIGTVTPTQLAFPYLVNWGYPERFEREQSDDERQITGIAGSPARSRASPSRDDRRRVRPGARRRHPRLPDDNPAWSCCSESRRSSRTRRDDPRTRPCCR